MTMADTVQKTPTAYEMFCAGDQPDGSAQEERERRFFLSVRLPNGTFKTTNHRRLDDLNALVNEHLPAARPLRVMDVAVSSGVSTAEWLEALEGRGISCEMVAGDLSASAFVISAGWGLRVLTNGRGVPLQFDVRGRAVRVDAGLRQQLRYALPLLWLRIASRAFFALQRPGVDAPRSADVVRAGGMEGRPVKLLSRRLSARKNLQVVDDDILVDRHFEKEFDVLRAANILNLVYFSKETLAAMVVNLRRRLRPGGLLVICRTLEDGTNHGSVFELDAGARFTVLARLNKGSEIEELVLGLRGEI